MREMPASVRKMGAGMKKTIPVPKWNHWVAYEKRDFDQTYKWMIERGLAPGGHTSKEVVAANSKEVFG